MNIGKEVDEIEAVEDKYSHVEIAFSGVRTYKLIGTQSFPHLMRLRHWHKHTEMCEEGFAMKCNAGFNGNAFLRL
jgi:hypothetical protein